MGDNFAQPSPTWLNAKETRAFKVPICWLCKERSCRTRSPLGPRTHKTDGRAGGAAAEAVVTAGTPLGQLGSDMLAKAVCFKSDHRECSVKKRERKRGASATDGGADSLEDVRSGAEMSAK